MINQSVSSVKSPYSDFNGFNKNPQFIMNKPPFTPQEEDKNNHVLAYSLGISALVLGFAILGFMRGTPKNLTKYLEKLKEYLEQKLQKSRNSKSMNWLSKGYGYALNKVNSLILKSESINNFTSVKDAGFKYIMGKTKVNRNIHNWITKTFTKASRATVKNSWANTNHKFIKNFDSLKNINADILSRRANDIIEINGIKKTGKEWLAVIEKHQNTILETLKQNSSAASLAEREKIMNHATDNLDKLIIAALKRYKNPRLYKSFIADEFITKPKENMLMDMINFRSTISMNSKDKRKLAAGFMQKVENLFVDGDQKLQQNITALKTAIKNNVPEDEIYQAFGEIKKLISSSKTTPKVRYKAGKYLESAQGALKNQDSGSMQEILSIYKKLAPEKYEKIVNAMSSSVKSLDKSIDTEAVQYFEKLRDLNVGSAPTDVLSILGSGAYIGYALHGNKDKDEKISVMLKQGIPVLSAIGTSLFCTARLISGSKAMLVGLLSGWIMNKVGNYTDELRKKYFPINPESSTKAV